MIKYRLCIWGTTSKYHMDFVDDVLIMGMLNRFAWLCPFHIFRIFANATALHMNVQKSIIFHGCCDMEIIAYIRNPFGIEAEMMKNGMKYLQYYIKPCSYRIVDWKWLVDHFFKRISGWEFRFLSLGGRVILTQVVLTQLGVYWAHLFHIPLTNINRIN